MKPTKSLQIPAQVKQLTPENFARLLALYIEESNEISWEGFTPQEVKAIQHLFNDFEIALKAGFGA